MGIKKVLTLFGVLALVLTVSASGAAPLSYYSSMYSFPTFDGNGEMVSPPKIAWGSWSHLETLPGGARQVIHGEGLPPGHAITSWWVVFNDPEWCTDGHCGEDDVFEHPERSNVSMLLGAGAVVDRDGEADFADFLMAGDTRKAEFGPGLVNPQTAEIHFVLRSHGRAEGRYLSDQLGSYAGGCDAYPPHADCKDLQFAVFKQ